MTNIDKYMTPAEAAHRWGLPQETVKARLKFTRNKDQIEQMIENGLLKSFIKPDGKRREWIISTDAMERWFDKKEK